MEVTIDQLVQIIGEQTVEIRMLEHKLRSLEVKEPADSEEANG